MLTENIYYVDDKIMKVIDSQFEFNSKKGWFILYKNKEDNSFWRLDQSDKLQTKIFLKLVINENWDEFDDKILRIKLLKKNRGLSTNTCIWKDCDKKALNKIIYCELHAYNEMGIRK
jgi:hypothetical protein